MLLSLRHHIPMCYFLDFHVSSSQRALSGATIHSIQSCWRLTSLLRIRINKTMGTQQKFGLNHESTWAYHESIVLILLRIWPMFFPSGPSSFILQLDKLICFCKRLLSTQTKIYPTGRLMLATDVRHGGCCCLSSQLHCSFVL